MHLRLESVDVILVGARDHKIIYIDPHDEAAYTDAAEINNMF
jgi:hypothetical protein